ncbi:MAG: type II toxin-antitoxin system death-on-curing family toxin [Thermodesulfovibrionia bacterium]|nr:type II toxin-antitoxin system death-on-curing family toxin [Thermodesulfovibrionia bacterium]
MRYLTAEQVLFIHSRLIDETGGSHGIRDLGLLQSAVSRPKATFGSEDLYPDICHKAAALMESLIKNHPFIDGNKRTAITSAGIFLQINGYYLKTTQNELELFTIKVATCKVSLENIVEWFKKYSSKQ